MKKTVLAVALAGSLAAGSALAEDPKFFVGAGINFNNGKFVTTAGAESLDIKKPKFGLGVDFGAKFNENFGVRIGYDYVKKGKKNDVNVKLNNFYADLIGYYPASQEVNIKGILGVGRLKSSVNGTGATNFNNAATADFFKAKVGFRVGAGVEYMFDENLAADFTVTYQKGKKQRFIKRNIQAAAGILWYI